MYRRPRPLRIESLECRWLLASDWQNADSPHDVNLDGIVAPNDVLLGINEINSPMLLGANGRLPDRVPYPDLPLWDTNGDGFLSSIDVLLIINALNEDTAPPSLSVQLRNDTAPGGAVNSDRITSDPTIAGQVRDGLTGVASLTVILDAGEERAVPFGADGSFTLFSVGSLQDGRHVAQFRARDGVGNSTPLVELEFTLDQTPPSAVIPRLAPDNDTGFDDTDGLTRLNTFVMTGDGPAGTVELFVNGVLAGEGLSGPNWRVPIGPLAEGTYRVTSRVVDVAGNTGPMSAARMVSIDSVPPSGAATLALSPASDTGELGDGVTSAARVRLVGQAPAGSRVTVLETGASGLSNQTGAFAIEGHLLAVGQNRITIAVTDDAGNASAQTTVLIVQRLAEQMEPDVVLRWNATLLEAIRRDATTPPAATRIMAMVHLAILDVVNAVDGRPTQYLALPTARSASVEAAVAVTAHRILSYAYPAQRVALDADLEASLDNVPAGSARDEGVALGQFAGDAMIAWRIQDGWDRFIPAAGATEPGLWQPTLPMFAPALVPQWGDVEPFVISSAEDYLPSGPPSLASAAYTGAWEEVRVLGAANSSTRTAQQTQIARFWADGSGTYTPPGHWNQIASEAALFHENSLASNARLFAVLNASLADAAIAAWQAKYEYDFWRPVTAIRLADQDGNPATQADENWLPLLVTPPFPEYVSGHSAFSAAAATVLESAFGNSHEFTTVSPGLPGVQRTFASFAAAATEAGRSRIYGGIHFEFANLDGQKIGEAIGRQAIDFFAEHRDRVGPTITVMGEPTSVAAGNWTLRGTILDQLSGVDSASFSLDASSHEPLTLDAQGNFSLTTALPLDGTADGGHTLTIRAVDAAGNSRERAFPFRLDTQPPLVHVMSPSDGAVLAENRLQGAVDGTGSTLTSLAYAWDSGPLVSLAFQSDSGTFSQPLDLSRIPAGQHVLTIRAIDAAGHVATRALTVTLADPIALSVVGHEPSRDAREVGTTFRPRVVFSRPVDAATLNSANLYILDATGNKVSAEIVAANEGMFAWLFPRQPMPGASRLELLVDGDFIRAATGELLDADGDGVPGGLLRVPFTTVSLTELPNTTIRGILADPGVDLKPGTFDDVRPGPDGVLMTEDDIYLSPIEGARVFILGREEVVITDAQGRFTLDMVPAGNVKLAIDGQTATNPPNDYYFPEMVMDLTIVPGRENYVMAAMEPDPNRAATMKELGAYLPRLATSLLREISAVETTLIGVDAIAAPNLTPEQRSLLTIEVQPNSLVAVDGQRLQSGQIGISTVPPELVRDMLPAGLLEHTFDITVQAPGISNFSVPAPMTFPNVFHAAPGTKLNFLSFDHTTGRLVIEGTATVSPDGKSVTTDPGSGITHPGWHGVTPPGGCNGSQEPPQNPGPSDDASDGDAGNGEESIPTTRKVVVLPLIFGESGAFPTLNWEAPKDDKEKKPEPPPADACQPKPAPKKPDEDETGEPYVDVQIKVSGPLADFMKPASGSVALTSGHFRLTKGSQEAKSFGAVARSFAEMAKVLGGSASLPFRNLNENLLYGSTVVITVEKLDTDGTKSIEETTYYLYRFLDAADANHSDGMIEFEDTLAGQGIARKKQLKLSVGGATPNITTTGPFTKSGTSSITISFMPTEPGLDQTGTLTIAAPAGPNQGLAGTIALKGDGEAPQKWYVITESDKINEDFVEGLEAAYPLATTAEKSLLGTLNTEGTYVFDRQKARDLARDAIAAAEKMFTRFEDGLDRISAPDDKAVVYNDFLHSAGDGGKDSDLGTAFLLDDTYGQYSTWDIYRNGARYGDAEAQFRLSEALNERPEGHVDIYVARFFSQYTGNWSRQQLVNSLGKTIAHELGHTLGLPHTNKFDPGDAMAQGFVLGNQRSFGTSGNAVKIALGLAWDRSQANQAITDYFNLFWKGKSSKDSVEPGEDIEDEPQQELEGGLLRLIDLGTGNELRAADFGTLTLGASPASMQFELINLGTQDVRISGHRFLEQSPYVALSGLPADLRLAPGEHVPLTLTLTPGAVGAHTTILVLSSDDLHGELELPVSGAVLADHAWARVEPLRNNLGGARPDGRAAGEPEAIRVVNEGAEPLTISSIRLIGGQDVFRLTGLPESPSSVPIVLATGESFTIGAAFTPSGVGLTRGIVEIVTNDPARPRQRATVVGTGLDRVVYPDWGNDFVWVRTSDGAATNENRILSNDAGAFSLFLAPDAPYEISVFDPVTYLIAHGSGRTASSGGFRDLTRSLVFGASTAPDSDFDGLPDDIERAVGTQTERPDTDRDGLDDYVEIQQGLDPLSGLSARTGILSALKLDGEAQQVVVVGRTEGPGQTVYVAAGAAGLAVVDASRPDRMTVLGKLTLPGDSTDVAVDAGLGIAAVAAGESGLHLVAVRDLSQPRLLNSIGDFAAVQVETLHGSAYVATKSGVAIVDLPTGEITATVGLPNNREAIALAFEGPLLYVLDSSNDLRVLDTRSTPPALRNGSARLSNAVSSGTAQLFVAGGTAYVAARNYFRGGYYAVNVADPDSFSAPVLWPPSGTTGLPRTAVAANQSGHLVEVGTVPSTSVNTLTALSLTGEEPVVVARIDLPATGTPRGLVLASGIAYVADGTAGLVAVNFLGFDSEGRAPQVAISLDHLDTDSNLAGVQLVEGSLMPILFSTLSDDGQLSNVELLLDDRIVLNDVSAPFELAAFLPARNGGSNVVSVRVRATDTGGNVGLSNRIDVELVPDTTSPTLIGTVPAEAARRGRDFRTLRLDFSEPIRVEDLNPASFPLTRAGQSTSLLPREIRASTSARSIWLSYDSLEIGDYQLRFTNTAIHDRAGNALAQPLTTLNFTVVPATAVWANPNGGNWDDRANWVDGRLPGPRDDVLIDVPGNVTITHRTGETTIRSLVANTAFTLSGGTLTVTQTVQVHNTFRVNGGKLRRATILAGADGQGVTIGSFATFESVTTHANVVVDGQVLQLVNGLNLFGELTLATGQNRTARLEGAGVISGTGRILVTGSGLAWLRPEYQTPLTLGPGVTLDAEGRRLRLGTSGENYPWANLGTIQARGATVELQGQVTTSGLGSFQIGDATVTLSGVLDNRNATLNVSVGNWIVDGGEIRGGTIAVPDGTTLKARSSVYLTQDVMLNGTLELATGNSDWVYLYLRQTPILRGAGKLLVSGTGTANLYGDYDGKDWALGPNVILDAANGKLILHGKWRNLGQISATSAQVELRGSFTTSALGQFQHDGATIDISGQLDNAGATLTLDAATTWRLANGTIKGGVVEVAGGALFTIPSFGQLDSVSLRGDLTVAPSASLQIRGGLELTGDLTLDTGQNRTTRIEGSGTISGAGRLVIEGTGTGWLRPEFQSPLMIGSGITVEADAKKLRLGTSSDNYSWENRGTIHARGAAIELQGLVTTAGLGDFLHENGSIELSGVIDNREQTLNIDSATEWVVDGGEIRGGTISVPDGKSLKARSSVYLTQDVTLNGTLELATGNSNWVYLYVRQTPILQGAGQILVSGTGTANLYGDYDGKDWSLGPGITVNAANNKNLVLRGKWSNHGVIDATGAKIELAGEFSTAGVGQLLHAGATIAISGRWDNSDATFMMDAAAVWKLEGGQLTGGEIRVADGADFSMPSFGTLDMVTLRGNLTLSPSSALTVRHGLQLEGDLTLDTGQNRTTRLEGSGVISGTGRIVVAGSGFGWLRAEFQSPLTFGAGVTIEADGKKLRLGNSGEGYPWENLGTIRARNAEVELLGQVTTSGLGALLYTGSTVSLQGLLDNRNSTFTIDGQTTWQVDGGTIRGGIIAAPDAASLPFFGACELDAVDLRIPVNLVRATVYVRNGLTLNAPLTFLSERNFDSNYLIFDGEQLLSGTGQIVFAGVSSNNFLQNYNPLTIGAGVTLRTAGQSATLGYSDRPIQLQGALEALEDGKPLTFLSPLINSGAITIGSGAWLEVKSSYTQSTTGTLNLRIAGPTQFGKLVVRAVATFTAGSVLNVTRVNGFVPDVGAVFPLITYGSRSGELTVNGIDLGGGGSLVPEYQASEFRLTARRGSLTHL